MKPKYNFLSLFLLLSLFACTSGKQEGSSGFSLCKNQDEFPSIIYSEGDNLQKVIDSAPAYSTIICNSNYELMVSEPIVINKPLTLNGLNARLPDKLGKRSIIEIKSENVTITDFELTGNASTVPQSERAALITIYTGSFHIESGLVKNSSKEGIEVDQREFPNPVDGGVIRDIVGKGCMRDVVSLGGPAGPEPHIRNILVENIRGYDSSLRGTVEVSDGAENITVRKIYAENCVYALDIQDHNKHEINSNVLISDVYAVRCTHAIRTANHANGHSSLTLQNITAEHCEKALYVYNTEGVTIQNVRIEGYNGKDPAMLIANCNALTIRDLTFSNCNSEVEGLLLKDCNNITVDGVRLLNSNKLLSGITFRLSTVNDYENLIIHNVCANKVQDAGIILERTNPKITLKNYIISDNISKIHDHIKEDNRLLTNNLN